MSIIFNFIKNNTAKIIAGCIVVSAVSSCDPTIDSLSFDLPEANSIEDLTGPSASFGFFQEDDEDNNIIKTTFSNSSTNGTIHKWDFGNGETSTEREPTAEYDNPGSGTIATYLVTLEVSDNFGVTDSVSDSITINGFYREGQLIDDYTLLISGESDDPVQIHDFSSEQDGSGHFASNIIDRQDGSPGTTATKWTANDLVTGTGDGMDDGEYVIIDLGAEEELALIRFQTDNKTGLNYAYQIQTSTNGTDFSFLIPEGATTLASEDWAFSEPGTAEWQELLLTTATTARYVKLIAYGRYSNMEAPLIRDSQWTNFEEIEFYITKE